MYFSVSWYFVVYYRLSRIVLLLHFLKYPWLHLYKKQFSKIEFSYLLTWMPYPLRWLIVGIFSPLSILRHVSKVPLLCLGRVVMYFTPPFGKSRYMFFLKIILRRVSVTGIWRVVFYWMARKFTSFRMSTYTRALIVSIVLYQIKCLLIAKKFQILVSHYVPWPTHLVWPSVLFLFVTVSTPSWRYKVSGNVFAWPRLGIFLVRFFYTFPSRPKGIDLPLSRAVMWLRPKKR